MSKTYQVKEMFGPTIQGEGSLAGTPVIFVRLSRCNRWNGRTGAKPNSICYYCDTDFVGGERLTFLQIMDEVNRLKEGTPIEHIILTGGEPLLQADRELFKNFYLSGIKVCIETNGSLPIPEGSDSFIFHISCSPKQPFSETRLEYCHDLKILHPWISKEITPVNFAEMRADKRFLQPIADESLKNPDLGWTLDELYKTKGYKLSLQTHKYIGVE